MSVDSTARIGLTVDTPGNEQAGLVLRDVGIPFGAREGLRHLSLTVGAGEHVALLGPSGAGKTTLLRAIAGLEPMSAGCVIVGGRDVTRLEPEQRGVVYLHQTPMLFPHLSVIDNVGFPLEVRGASRAVARKRAGELLERVRLSNLSHRDANALSGGQRHRVALARALAANPRVLLLDEPFNALDPALRGDVRDAVFTMLAVDDGPAVVLVTHDVDEAAGLADRIVVLLDGVVAQDAEPSLLLSHPANAPVARFLGIPNIISGVVDGHGAFRCPLGAFPTRLPQGRAALVCRPDAIVARASVPASPLAIVRDVVREVVRSDVRDDVRNATRNDTRDDARAQGLEHSRHHARGTVLEVRERISGGLVLVRVASEESDTAVRLLAQRGDDLLAVGGAASLDIDSRRVHVVSESAS